MVVMVSGDESPRPAEVQFEGDSLEVLSAFPSAVKQALGFALRQLQIGREPTCQTRRMSSIGPGVYELKEADEQTWYRAIYLAKVENVSMFCTASRRTAGRPTGETLELRASV
jgi:phage-related protein